MSIDTFTSLVKSELQSMLGVSIYSIEDEAQAGSEIAKALDQSASSDLLIRYESDGSLFAAASRLMFCDQHILKLDMSITLRDSVGGDFSVTELNKLHSSLRSIRNGIPALLPRYMCYARVTPRGIPEKLHDMLVIETIPLIDHVFSTSHFDLPGLRRRMLSEQNRETLLDPTLRHLAGIRTTGNRTFVFLSKQYLDQNGIPYRYRMFT
ncbi:hypothetical protein LL974_19400 [Xanthomonas campestris pv. cannae]|nr:hypothetical protein [Xanthomonas campestris pv. cannae]